MAGAPQQLPQFNTAGNMGTVLHACLANVVLSGNQIMFESGITGFPAGWVAPLPGVLFAISGAQRATSSTTTLSLVVNVNGQSSGFSTTPLAFSGAIQTFSIVAGQAYPFNANDIITLVASPSAALATGAYASAALAVLM